MCETRTIVCDRVSFSAPLLCAPWFRHLQTIKQTSTREFIIYAQLRGTTCTVQLGRCSWSWRHQDRSKISIWFRHPVAQQISVVEKKKKKKKKKLNFLKHGSSCRSKSFERVSHREQTSHKVRLKETSCNGKIISRAPARAFSSIERGLMVLVGLSSTDTESELDYAVKKILQGRYFENAEGKPWSGEE